MKTLNQDDLSQYINKYAIKENFKKKDENRTIYWGYVSCSNCDADGNEDGGAGLNVINLIKENKYSKEVLDKLIELTSTSSINKITRERHNLKGKIILSSQNIEDNIATISLVNISGRDNILIDNVKYEINPDEIVFWVEYNSEGKIRVKNILVGDSFDKGMETSLMAWDSQLDWQQKTFFEKFVSTSYELVDDYFSAAYDMLDMLSSAINKAKIPAEIYDCSHVNYKPIYAKIFSYLNFTSLIQDKIVAELLKSYPEYGNILNHNNSTPSRIQFALFCGVYNGLVDVIKSVPDLAKLLISPLSSKGRDDVSKFIEQISEKEIYLEDEITLACDSCGKGMSFPKVWYFLKQGIESKLTLTKPCETAEFIGSIAGPIVVMCLGDEVAGAGIVSRVASTTIKIFKYCDRLTDPFRYAGMSFKFVKSASGKALLLVKDATGDVIRQLDNGAFRVKVIFDNIERVIEVTEDQLGLLVQDSAGAILNINGVQKRLELLVL
ncbi:MAG: hypothetical protein HC854_01860 [Flavobacterium sp.]|nr:hypothetical protein [Flavobacterium sp.]